MASTRYGVTHYNPSKAHNGYTLFASMGCKDIWLMDMQGRFINRWPIPDLSNNYGRLLPNGHLVYGCRSNPEAREKAGAPKFSGFGGIMREVDWDNNVIWEYEDHFMHHDYFRLENGNTLVMRLVELPKNIADELVGGVPGTEDNGKIWCDCLQEVTPNNEIVWEWFSYEHLDPVNDPLCALCPRSEWTHGNSVSELPDGNLLVSFRQINSIFIIHKETGYIKWKWGAGLAESAHAHDAHPLPNGNFLIFDNGFHRGGAEISSSMVIELNPKTKKVEWEYRSEPLTDFYSAACGSAQRLPNGNTLICSSLEARIFEVTEKGEIVWEYINPFFGEMELGTVNWVFRAYRYAPEYEGLKGMDLSSDKLNAWNRIYGSAAFRT